jgi:hypothetical protein
LALLMLDAITEVGIDKGGLVNVTVSTPKTSAHD